MSEANLAETMSETNSSLSSRCMVFTKHLVNTGMAFKLSLTLPTGFNFSVDLNLEKVMPTKVFERKKQSPSTLKRNALRKKAFLEKKAVEKLTEQQTVKSPAEHTDITFKCNQCEVSFISKDTLNKHITENTLCTSDMSRV